MAEPARSAIISASTHSQALNVLVFLYREVLEIEPGWTGGLRRLQRKTRPPIVLSPHEISRVLDNISGTPKQVAELLYAQALGSVSERHRA